MWIRWKNNSAHYRIKNHFTTEFNEFQHFKWARSCSPSTLYELYVIEIDFYRKVFFFCFEIEFQKVRWMMWSSFNWIIGKSSTTQATSFILAWLRLNLWNEFNGQLMRVGAFNSNDASTECMNLWKSMRLFWHKTFILRFFRYRLCQTLHKIYKLHYFNEFDINFTSQIPVVQDPNHTWIWMTFLQHAYAHLWFKSN